ncbi:MAG: nucleoside/nucleotide kinase family protein [Mycobacteriales bacterium]
MVDRAAGLVADGRRALLGITGPPGAGKSTLAEALVAALPGLAALVPMDGFHLANSELERLGRDGRKGALDTFDAAGYVQLLRRLRERPEAVVYAPLFVRDRELAEAGAIPVPASITLVVTEGNYLLAGGPFAAVRGLLSECWYVDADPVTRRERLVARHIRHGRSHVAAQTWVERVDEPNAARVARSRDEADLVVHLPDSLG